MGTYIAAQDLYDECGESNVIKWSQLDPDSQATTADTDRIARAIQQAESEVESRLRRRFAIPLTGTNGTLPYEVKSWCAKLACVWLYELHGVVDETNRHSSKRAEAREAISQVLAGQMYLECVETNIGGTAPIVIR